jgi:hypothetical protein
MTALAANRERRTRGEAAKVTRITPANSQQFYEGGLVAANASGLGAPAADTASFRVAGVAPNKLLSAASSPAQIELEWGHEEWFPVDSALQTAAATSTFKNAIVADDNTLTNAATATNDVPVGIIVEFEAIKGVNGAWVRVGVFSPTNA